MIDKQLVTPSLEPKGFTGRAVAELICLTGWNAEARQWHGWHEWKKINTERGKQWKALLLLRTHLQMDLHPRNDLRGILPDEKGYAVTHYIFFLYKKEICYILLWILLIFFFVLCCTFSPNNWISGRAGGQRLECNLYGKACHMKCPRWGANLERVIAVKECRSAAAQHQRKHHFFSAFTTKQITSGLPRVLCLKTVWDISAISFM